jgi:hypothetical protein
VANYLWLLNDGSSRILLNNGTDKLALNEEVVADAYGWQQPPSEPRASQGRNTRQRALVAALAGFVLTPISYPGTADALASTVTTSVRYDKTIIFDDLAYTPYVAADVTVDKYGRPFSEPTRVKVRQNEGSFVYPYQTVVAAVGDDTARPFTVTTSVRHDRSIDVQDFAYAPYVEVAAEVVTSDKWYAPFSQPRFVKRITGAEGSLFLVGDDASKYAWRGPLSEPVRRIPQAREGDYTQAPTQPQANDGIGWHQPFATPTVRITGRQQQEFIGVPFNEQTLVAKWHHPFGTPRAARRAAEYQSTFYSPYVVVVEEVTLDKYAAPFSEPVRRKPLREGVSVVAPTQPQANDGIGWHRPFNEPTRRKNFLEGRVAYSPTLIEDAGIQAKWYQPFSVPRAAKRVPEFPAYAYSPYFVPPITGDATALITWANLSEPVRRSVYRQHQTFAFDPVPFPAWDWARPLSEPTRRTTTRQQQELASVPFIENAAIQAKWFQPFGLPRAAKRVAEFPAFSYSPYFVPSISGVGTEFNWWPNLSERLRQRRPVTQQQAVIQGPSKPIAVTLEHAWHQPFSVPTRDIVRRQSPSFAYLHLVDPVTGVAPAFFGGPIFSRHLISQTLGMPAFVPPPPTPGDGAVITFSVSTSVRFDKTIIFEDCAWTPGFVPSPVVSPPPCLIDTLGVFDNSDVPFGDNADTQLADSSDDPFGDAADDPGSFDNEDEAPC